MPSSNINLGISNTIFSTPFGDFVIASSSQEMSGVGVQIGVAGYLRKHFGNATALRLDWQVNALHYPQNRQFSAVSAALGLGFIRQTDTGSWSLTPHLRQTRTDAGQNGAAGLKFGLHYRLGERLGLRVGLAHEYRLTPGNTGKSGPFPVPR